MIRCDNTDQVFVLVRDNIRARHAGLFLVSELDRQRLRDAQVLLSDLEAGNLALFLLCDGTCLHLAIRLIIHCGNLHQTAVAAVIEHRAELL